jgi:hypothetical protein
MSVRGLLGRPKPQPEPHVVERQERREREQKQDLVAGVRSRGKVDVGKLTTEEARELHDLHRKAVGHGPYPVEGLGLLDAKERKRLGELLEKCVPDSERERLRRVEEARQERELQRFAAEVVAGGVPPRLRPGIRPGEVVLPREAFELGTLHLGDLGLLSLVVYAWSSANAGVFRGGGWSNDGEALFLPKKLVLADRSLNLAFGLDGGGRVVDVGATFEHLDRNGFLDIDRSPGGWTIRLGPRLRDGWSS